MKDIIFFLDHAGVFIFAMSGVLAASGKGIDLFGGLIIAFVTALGGGTLRDLLLNVDVIWVQENDYVYLAFGGAFFALIFRSVTKRLRRTMFLFDTIGIALFTILGVEKAMILGHPTVITIIFGVMTATFGGVIRDILCNEIPLIFRKEIYATACLAGAGLYVGLHAWGVDPTLNTVVSCALIVAIRIVAVVKKLAMPVINDRI